MQTREPQLPCTPSASPLSTSSTGLTSLPQLLSNSTTTGVTASNLTLFAQSTLPLPVSLSNLLFKSKKLSNAAAWEVSERTLRDRVS